MLGRENLNGFAGGSEPFGIHIKEEDSSGSDLPSTSGGTVAYEIYIKQEDSSDDDLPSISGPAASSLIEVPHNGEAIPSTSGSSASSHYIKEESDLIIPTEMCELLGDRLKENGNQLHSSYTLGKRIEENKPSGSGAKTKNKLPYSEVMTFLNHISGARVTSGLARESSDQAPSLPDQLGLKTANLVDGNISILATKGSSAKTEHSKASKTKFKVKKVAPEGDEMNIQYLQEVRKNNSSKPDENDPNRLFLLSLVPLMNQLTTADSIDFKLFALQFLKSKLNPMKTGQND